MAEQKSNPTMKDVAREAGVALGTVSKVVNGIPVGEDYRVRVEKAIQKLNYHINNYAKGLKSGKTMIIAVMVPNLVSPYFASLVNSIGNGLIQHRGIIPLAVRETGIGGKARADDIAALTSAGLAHEGHDLAGAEIYRRNSVFHGVLHPPTVLQLSLR